RLVDLDMWQRRRRIRMSHGFADVDTFDTCNGQNIAGPPNRFVDAFQAFERIQFRDAGFFNRALEFGEADIVTESKRAVKNAPNRESTEVVAVVEVRDKQLKHSVGIARRIWNLVDDRLKQRPQIVRWIVELQLGNSGAGVGVDDRKVELLFGCIE